MAAKNLVIVESPAKARTLNRYLGKDYVVKASIGHVADLPKSKLGVNVENDFEPEYQVIRGKKKVIDELRKAAKDKENVYLAPDPDREGEAIAWHIAQRLGRTKNVYRVLFNEITKRAVEAALERPQSIDEHRVDAQNARRILDRLVGYQLSPLLWDKVRRGIGAGRVQSVAVRLICEREKEIEAFQAIEYWSLDARLEGRKPPPFTAKLFRVDGESVDPKKRPVANETEAKEILAAVEKADWIVSNVEQKERKRNPAPPFITSSLQQEASRKLGYVPRRTMSIAQRLYEGIEIGSEGAVGLITYMRTDSTRLSNDAVGEARRYIGSQYGKEYLPEHAVAYRSKKDAQDAHEAIRPTSLDYPPDRVAGFLQKDELAVYTLIWNRFVACQMMPAIFDQTAVDVDLDRYVFRATGQVMRFDGFMRVYFEGRDDTSEEDDDEGRQLPDLAVGDRLRLLELLPEQHFTQPPPRYTQASLIRALEENGIGRPSTYASIMNTIIDHEYVRQEKDKRLHPTHLGRLVTDLLVGSFPNLVNQEFTAGMETILDRIEEGAENWVDAIRRFYKGFEVDLRRAEKEMPSVKGEGQKTDLVCEKCGKPMVIKWGRQGEFLACSGYPECRNTKDFTTDENGKIQVAVEETVDEACPECGKPLAYRRGRYGKFLGCTGYPECKYVKSLKAPPKPIGMACPECKEGELQERSSRRGKVFYGCSRYPKCKFASWDRPVKAPCPQCGSTWLVEKETKREGRFRKCPNKECTHREDAEEVEARSA